MTGLLAAVVGGAEPVPQGLHLTASTVPAGDWPAYRRDGALSGFSPLAGGLERRPEIRWSVDLGGEMVNTEQAQLVDLNGDGQEEVLRTLADRLICQTIQGERIWETESLPQPRVTHIRDFAGDGTRGLLVSASSGVEHHRYMVSGVTGQAVLLYTNRNVFGGYERHGEILAGAIGEQLCAWWSGDSEAKFGGGSARGVGYLWSFENGLAAPNRRFHADEEGTIYAPLHLFADMNGNGQSDMVMISHEQMWVYDLAIGLKTMQASWGPQIRTYWAATAAIPLAPGEKPSLLMINPMIPGVQVVTQDGVQAVSLWKQVFGGVEDQYQPKVRVGPAAPDPFVDLDGDGEIEILVAATNEQDDGQTHLVILRASDGQRLYDAPNETVLTVDDLDGDTVPEILVRDGEQTLRICHWNGTQLVDRWRGDDVEALITPAPPEGRLDRAVGARNTGINMPLWRDVEGSNAFLMRFADGVFGCLLRAEGLERVRRIESHAAIASAKEANPEYSWDGKKLTVDEGERVTYQVPRRQAYAAEPPIVGRLGSDRRIVVRESSGAVVSLAPDGSERRVLIDNAPSARGACLTDLDGDGDLELLIPVAREDGRVEITAVDGTGSEKLTIPGPPDATEVELGPSGRLGPGEGRWFVVRYRVPFENTQVVAYDGKTGRSLWTRDYLGPGRTSSTTFVLHLPTAVYDVDGDGADDLIASSENWYEVIGGKDNRTVTPNWVITAAVPGHWGAYATPIVADVLGNGEPLVFHNNAFALTLVTKLDGTPYWHYGLTRDTTHASKAGLADLDGDGKVEIVTTQKDGLLRAFDAAQLTEKCPRCPQDQELGDANQSGHVRWTYRLPPPLSDFASVDLDADGRTELICGAGDGKLYALKETGGQCEVLWVIDLGSAVGSPVVADLGGDHRPELLVTTADGLLHCLGSE
jgi:hypothetical protein